MRKIGAFLSHVCFPAWSFPLAVIALGAAAYGVLMPWLGFYWDDWAKLAVTPLFGLEGYGPYYAEDRPLSAWTHMVFTPLLGLSPFTWQLFQFGLTVLSAWGVYWSLSSLWPRARWQSAAAALLFLVYPAFNQHPPAVTFHQQWLQYALYLLSLGLMLQAVRSPRRYWLLTGLALACAVLQLSVTEYFAPLELLRPLLLWILVGQVMRGASFMQRARRTLALWLQYLVLVVAYGVWRLFFIQLSGDDPYRAEMLYAFLAQPIPTLLALLRVMLQDSLHTLVAVWGSLLVTARIETLAPFHLLSLIAGAACAVLAAVYLLRLKAEDSAENWRGQALAVGAAAFALGLLPAWITGREVVFDFHSDRYAMAGMFGASLLWMAAIDWLTAARLKRAALVALLIGLAVSQQLRAGNEYRWLWETETEFFWQLYWRAPHLEKGTALLTYQEIVPNQGLFSLSSALNLLYPHETNPQREYLDYWWYTLYPRYHVENLPEKLDFDTQFRSLKFKGGSPDTLLVHYDPAYTHCLWVVGEADHYDLSIPPLMREMAKFSSLNTIRAEPLDGWKPPAAMFGAEPERGWCYFFEKADLAQQLEDWSTAAALGDEAQAAGYSPLDARSNAPHEWLPFIAAYAHEGRWAEAAELSLQSAQMGREHYCYICTTWQRMRETTPDSAEKQAAVDSVWENLVCADYVK